MNDLESFDPPEDPISSPPEAPKEDPFETWKRMGEERVVFLGQTAIEGSADGVEASLERDPFDEAHETLDTLVHERVYRDADHFTLQCRDVARLSALLERKVARQLDAAPRDGGHSSRELARAAWDRSQGDLRAELRPLADEAVVDRVTRTPSEAELERAERGAPAARGLDLITSRETDPDPESKLFPPAESDQRALESVLEPGTVHPHPLEADGRTAPWVELVNDGGYEQAGRDLNCVDCSLSALSTWLGRPEVAASQFGKGEHPDRAERLLGSGFNWQGAGASGLAAVADRLRAEGPGSAAVVEGGNRQRPGEQAPIGHAFVAVNDAGSIVWIDAQVGIASTEPLETDFDEIVAIFVS